MVRGGAAAATDDGDAVALHEFAEGRRERLGLLRENRFAIGSLQRQAGVGDAMDRQGGGLAQVADGVPHVLRAGRAVQPDHLDIESGQRRQDCLDVRPEEHFPSLRQEGDRRLDRQGAPGLLERLAGAEDRGLHLQDVLRRLDDDQVGAAIDQAPSLLGEDLDQLCERDVSEGGVVARRQEARWADGACDEAIRAGGLTRDLRGHRVDFRYMLTEPPLVQLQTAPLEGVGLDHLRPRFEHGCVDPLDHVGPVQDQRLVALALQAPVILRGEVELLEGRAHAAVEDDDTLADRPQVVALRHGGEG